MSVDALVDLVLEEPAFRVAVDALRSGEADRAGRLCRDLGMSLVAAGRAGLPFATMTDVILSMAGVAAFGPTWARSHRLGSH